MSGGDDQPNRFDPARATAFSSYAVPTMLGELKRYFRDNGWAVHVPRGMQERVMRVDATMRELSRSLGLPTADAPAQPCLSSRIPHGTPVTREAIDLVERGEAFVRSLGFRVFRVRYVAGILPGALVQVAPAEETALGGLCDALVAGLRDVGFGTVEIDPAGYRGISA